MSIPLEDMVLIVGGGFAGAACALRLSEYGIKSVILEAQHRLGGRAQTRELAPGVLIDFGASNVHGYEHGDRNPARRLAEKLGVELQVPQPSPGLVYTADGNQIPSEKVSELQKQIGKVMSERTPEKDQEMSLGKRVIEELRAIDPEAEGLARTAELGAGIRLEDISARYWKTERGFAGVDALPVGGYSELVRKAVERSRAEVHLGQDVKSIKLLEEGVSVSTHQGKTFETSHLISTIPIAVLQTGRVAFDPPLPAERDSLLQRVSIGLLDKFSLLYPSVWWLSSSANFVLLPAVSARPSSLTSNSTIQDILSSTTLMVANMHALSPSKPPVLLAYLPPHAASLLEHFDDKALTSAFHSFISSRLSSSTSSPIQEPTAGQMVRWKADPYSLGATTSPIALGKDAQPDDLDRLGEPLWDGKLGFAGEGTDRHLRGSVPGAVASGEREADRLARLLGKPEL